MNEYKRSTCIHSSVCNERCIKCNCYYNSYTDNDEVLDCLIEDNRHEFFVEWLDYLDKFYD